jgi:hypothetical protein
MQTRFFVRFTSGREHPRANGAASIPTAIRRVDQELLRRKSNERVSTRSFVKLPSLRKSIQKRIN